MLKILWKNYWVIGASIILIVMGVYYTVVKEELRPITCYDDVQISVPHVPQGAPHNSQKILRKRAPKGFAAGTGWITATTATECITHDKIAQITIKDFTVIAQNSNGEERVIFTQNEQSLIGGWFDRFPQWFATNDYDAIFQDNEKEFVADLSVATRRILHAWTPRFAASPDEKYFVVAQVKIDGIARLEFGIDYWRDFDVGYNFFDEFCRGTNNCEAWVSDWIGDTEGKFMEVKFPEM